MPLKRGGSACPSGWPLPQKHKWKKLSVEVWRHAGKTSEKRHKISSVISVECLMSCIVLFWSGSGGSMSILQSFPAERPSLTVAKTRRAWWHGEHLLNTSLMCSASMNQVGCLHLCYTLGHKSVWWCLFFKQNNLVEIWCPSEGIYSH